MYKSQSYLSEMSITEERTVAPSFQSGRNDLEEVLVRQLDQYFAQLDGRDPHPLYELVLHAVERPLILYAMTRCRNNQCAAADLLGINRNTLRKKLAEHGLLQPRANK